MNFQATISIKSTSNAKLIIHVHFLPPGVAYTTGLSHNRFTWLPL